MNHFRFLCFFIVSFLIAGFALHGEEPAHLKESIVLFGKTSSPPVSLRNDRGWVPIGMLNWNVYNNLSTDEAKIRKWRLRSTYEFDRDSGPSTVQIRLRGGGSNAIFTHPWSEGAERTSESYSNWYEDTDQTLDSGKKAIIEARLVSPPRKELSGKIYIVVLEGWEREKDSSGSRGKKGSSSGYDVQLAYTNPLSATSPNSSTLTEESKTTPSKNNVDSALTFALNFVEASITGDLAAYYRLQADSVYSLDNGEAMIKYRLNPPAAISNVSTIENYKARFQYEVYDYGTMRELFPEWFDSSRSWTPSKNAWLFMGHKDLYGDNKSNNIDYLVFVVEQNENGKWNVIARPRH